VIQLILCEERKLGMVCRVLSQEMHESRMAPATTLYIIGGGRSRQCGGVDKYTLTLMYKREGKV